MIGKRIENQDNHIPNPGEYYSYLWRGQKLWFGMTPNGLLANISSHNVVEHEDGTITVSPSILVNEGCGEQSWHGFLEMGVWREC